MYIFHTFLIHYCFSAFCVSPSENSLFRTMINKWNLMKLKCFYIAKDIIIQTGFEWEKTFTNCSQLVKRGGEGKG